MGKYHISISFQYLPQYLQSTSDIIIIRTMIMSNCLSSWTSRKLYNHKITNSDHYNRKGVITYQFLCSSMLQPKSPSTVPTNCAMQHFGDQTDPLSGYKHPVVNNGLYAAHNMDILSPPILQTSSFYIRSAMQTSLLGALEPLSIHNTDGQSTPAVSASVVGHKTMICISVYPAALAELFTSITLLIHHSYPQDFSERHLPIHPMVKLSIGLHMFTFNYVLHLYNAH